MLNSFAALELATPRRGGSLYERYLPVVWRQAYALVSDVHAAEDVTSETMLALLRNIGQLEADAPQVAALVDRSRSPTGGGPSSQGLSKARSAALDGRCAAWSPPKSNPPVAVEAEETRDHVLKVLDALPDRQRLVLEWKYLDGLSVREIAERLGETERSIEAILYRARRGFRHLFELKHLRARGKRTIGHRI